jgi:competence protein ComEA
VNETSPSTHFLTTRQQQTIAVLLAVATLLLTVRIVSMGSRMGEVDDVEPRPIHYLVNVNQARWQELAQLPGIGEELARRIITRRERQGPYTSPDQLRDVKGIGPKTMERIRPHVETGEPLGG